MQLIDFDGIRFDIADTAVLEVGVETTLADPWGEDYFLKLRVADRELVLPVGENSQAVDAFLERQGLDPAKLDWLANRTTAWQAVLWRRSKG